MGHHSRLGAITLQFIVNVYVPSNGLWGHHSPSKVQKACMNTSEFASQLMSTTSAKPMSPGSTLVYPPVMVWAIEAL